MMVRVVMSTRRFASHVSEFFHTQAAQSGQVGVVILLMMAVILTVGLSVVSRTTQDLSLSNQISDSAKVFNAAESGVDQAIAQLQASFVSGTLNQSGTLTVNETDVNYTISPSNVMEARIFEGNSVMINVVDRTTNPTGLPAGGSRSLRIDWSNPNFDADCSVTPLQPASLVAFIYSVNGAATNLRTIPVGGCNRSDGFTAGSTTGATAGYRFWYNLPLQAGDLFVRIKPVYNDTHMRIIGNSLTLPTNFYTIVADARNQNGNESHKIQVNQTLPTAPSVMDYVLYSGTSLNK